MSEDREYIEFHGEERYDWTWVGSSGVEASVHQDRRDLAELIGLDRGTWLIVGMELSGRGAGGPNGWDLEVYALNKAEYRASDSSGFNRLYEERGSVPVESFLVRDVDPSVVLNSFKTVSMRAFERDYRRYDVVDKHEVSIQE